MVIGYLFFSFTTTYTVLKATIDVYQSGLIKIISKDF